MRARIVSFVMACVAAATALAQSAGSMGIYQSTLDGTRYELRTVGDKELHVYSLDGRVLAIMDRSKPTDNYKGKTQALATRCPNNSGKIETTAVAPGRVRMRVEEATQSVTKTVGCNMITFPKWVQFDFIKLESGGSSGADTPTSGRESQASGSGQPVAAGPTTSVNLRDVRLTFVDAVAEAKTLTMTLTALNQGLDSVFLTCSAKAIDEAGNSYDGAEMTLGNRSVRHDRVDIVSDVPTKLVLKFNEIPTRGGVPVIQEIRRLTLRALLGQGGRCDYPNTVVEVELRNLPVTKR